ncbi:MAG: CxxC motif-containing protein (DUF1111 family) [Alphaproteobacteria bacterium]|jgi:CxxC motif-containing protein (DUF1111 family)
MLKKCILTLLIFSVLLSLATCERIAIDDIGKQITAIPYFSAQEHSPGGSMTAKRLSDRSFVTQGQIVKGADKLDFWTGFSLFRNPWVIAPSSTADRDGLGPLFNTRSCISCHLAGARGHPPISGVSKPSALVIRLGPQTNDSDIWVDKNYGDQIQPRAIPIRHTSLQQPLQGEAKLDLEYTEIKGRFADGTHYSLQKPNYRLVDLAQGPLQPNIGMSPRFAPVVYGLGLIDAIAQHDLLSQEDLTDTNNDGISAKYNRVASILTKHNNQMPVATTSDNTQKQQANTAIGRFGAKAKHPTLAQQVAAALRDDIGITNSLFPQESCTTTQEDCGIASALGGQKGVEIPNKLLHLVNQFTQFLAVPPARNLANRQVQQGRTLFYKAQCAACHTPSYKTAADYPVAALASQTIYPYSNFALHDMGQALADGVYEFDAGPSEWRTPPLWGLGLQKKYKKNAVFLHDGRARTITEAILWHGGEAEQSQQHFINMSSAQRQALLAFLQAI